MEVAAHWGPGVMGAPHGAGSHSQDRGAPGGLAGAPGLQGWEKKDVRKAR